MNLLLDFLPIIVFFIAFKFFGIYIATAAAIIVSILQVSSHWLRHRHVSGLQLLSLVLIVGLGGSTLVFHSEIFIKWKPTVLNWALAILFLGSQWLGKKPFIQRLLEGNVKLTQPTLWQRLNTGWVIFFSIMGALNLYVAYHYTTNTWVNFKLFGVLGLTFVFVILQALYLSRHMATDENPVQKSKL